MLGTTEIFLSDRAFLSIILSSVEVYKNECHGALLGIQSQRRIIAEYAIPFQAAERKFSEVTPNWRRELKVIEVLPKLVHLQKLGYFHSHPQFGNKRGTTELSEFDKDFMQEGETEIVVAINDARKTLPWTESKTGLSGTLGKYRITIAGFYKRKKDGKIVRYRVLCPYAVGFDYAFKR
ncbi:MAG: Mov34/MPN/PAD-1 family protein [Candidatus Bathyarchaeota archaeon]|nr:Mov34/MPN/PAD-1 family protein [Candidatus Bathyarchaeota archaeon]MDH5786888.1 Mov34/MPN/PAD-1 family protein [Candidatus Bathyarchaeota archaeon]